MDTVYWVILILTISALVFFLGKYFTKLAYESKLKVLESELKLKEESSVKKQKELEENLINLNSENTKLKQEQKELYIKNTQLHSEVKSFELKIEEQKSEVQKLQEQSRKDFELLANKILEEKSKTFTQQNKLNLEQVLNPLKDKIKDFESKIETSHKESIEKHASLKQHIENLSKLNQQITQETTNLTRALKSDNKAQGNWGELVLDRVLEKSGLEEGREYEKQVSENNSEGKTLRPDVVIHLPNKRKMVIDSKVSLTAYERYVNEEIDTEKESSLKQHIFSINSHINQLSEKNYHSLFQESPDFVLMFIPVEPAFAVAINHDSNLYNKAFEKNIIIVTPTTLLATLRTVDSLWNNEKQQQNAIEIATQAGKLYDKFVGLMDDLRKIGSQLGTVQKSYESSMRKLVDGPGNVIGKIENLRKMGAKASKTIPENLKKRAEED